MQKDHENERKKTKKSNVSYVTREEKVKEISYEREEEYKVDKKAD